MLKKLCSCLFIVAFFASAHQAVAQGAQFFRVSGPTAVTILEFLPNGTLIWSNALPGATYTVQTGTTVASGTNWVDYVQIPVAQVVNTNQIVAFNPPAGMAFVPAGIFTMGDTLDGESDALPTNIYVSAFYMDVNLVSYDQMAGGYAYATNHGYGFSGGAEGVAGNYPVDSVDWYDCVAWCNARSQQEGLTPVYYTDAFFTQLYTNDINGAIPFANFSANGYRLPTEAEWEKAARGGLNGQRFPWGPTINETQANYYADPVDFSYDLGPYTGYNTNFDAGVDSYTSPVGCFAPNGYGLYDMAGNLWEWCWDLYGAPYGQQSNTNPTGATTGSYRVTRGGSWDTRANYARCAQRGYTDASGGTDFGFRTVRTP